MLITSGATVINPNISNGSLELQSGAAASGGITFSGSSGMLKLDGSTMPDAIISGFSPGDTVDLTNIAYTKAGTVSLTSGNMLKITENNSTYSLQLNPSETFGQGTFHLGGDINGGTIITLVPASALTVVEDLGSSNRAQLLWTHSTTSDATTDSSRYLTGFNDLSHPDPSYRFAGMRDFDASFGNEMLWEDRAAGYYSISGVGTCYDFLVAHSTYHGVSV